MPSIIDRVLGISNPVPAQPTGVASAPVALPSKPEKVFTKPSSKKEEAVKKEPKEEVFDEKEETEFISNLLFKVAVNSSDKDKARIFHFLKRANEEPVVEKDICKTCKHPKDKHQLNPFNNKLICGFKDAESSYCTCSEYIEG